MNNPGYFSLGSRAITTALTGEVLTSGTSAQGGAQAFIDRLSGAKSASFQVHLAYGSGGTSGKVYIQTSLDQGETWIDIACVTFTTASLTKVVNLSALTPKTTAATPADGALADDTCVDGILGDRFRSKTTTVGTYAGTTLDIDMVVR